MCVCSVMSDFLRPLELQPSRLLCPWDSASKNTAVGCHFLLQLLCKSWLNRSRLHSCRCVSGVYILFHWSVCSPDTILSGLPWSWSWVVSIFQVCSLLVLSFASFCKPQNHFREIDKVTSWNLHLDCIASISQVGKNCHFDTIEASYSRTQNISLFSFSLILFIRVL